MKLLSVRAAKSILLIATEFLNPRGKDLLPIIAGIVERYHFVKAPQSSDLAAQPLELKFEGGSFLDRDGQSLQVNASIFSDGVIAETRDSTDASDRFLDDALNWLSEAYELPLYKSLGTHERLYSSEVVAELSLPHSIFSDKFSNFIRRLQHGVSNNPGVPMDFYALNFGPDPSATKRVAQFRVERLVGSPFRKREYYSAAPIPTNEHLELLIAMEEAASS
jgi:hypothetical protein